MKDVSKPYSFLAIYQIEGETLKRREIILAANIETAADVLREKLKDVVSSADDDEIRRLRAGDYLGIMYWGRALRSGTSYIANQQEQAFDNNAPLDALATKWDEKNHCQDYQNWYAAKDAIPNKQIAVDYKAFLAERGYAS